MIIASVIKYETAVHTGPGRGDEDPISINIHLGTDFHYNTEGDGDRMYAALVKRLQGRFQGTLTKDCEPVEISSMESKYYINITFVLSWLTFVNDARVENAVAVVLKASGNNLRDCLKRAVPLRLEKVEDLFNSALRDRLSPRSIDLLIEYYMTEFIGVTMHGLKKRNIPKLH